MTRPRLDAPAILAFLLTLAVAGSAAVAQDDDPPPPDDPPPGDDTGEPPSRRIAESETAYTGAVMLTGGVDVQVGAAVAGDVGPSDVRRNARFIGNTLYAEATDGDGNAVAMIAEFYWFESSVPRGSDFFVAVVKARTIPHLAADWVLEHSANGPIADRVRIDRGPTLYVRATTGDSLEDGGFRWDWSLPFRDYGMDAYGTVRMKADYGVGLMSNGAAQTAYQRNEHGVEVMLDGQAVGHFNGDYNVNTNYEVTLYRWDVFTRNSGNLLEWTLFLRTGDREAQNAYHEYFIAMQTAEGSAFYIDSLEVGGHIKKRNDFWLDEHRALSVRLNDVMITRPSGAGSSPPTDDEDDPADRPWERPRDDGGTGSDDFDWPEPEGFDDTASDGGCSTSAMHGGSTLAWLVLGGLVVAARRRRRD
jgi:MYXO-CTERM domain-containing protein